MNREPSHYAWNTPLRWARRPACMTDEEWADWSALNDRLLYYSKDWADSPCHDCLAPFRRAMRAAGNCDVGAEP